MWVALLWKPHGYSSGIVGSMLSGPGRVLATLGGPVPGFSQILGLRQPLKTQTKVGPWGRGGHTTGMREQQGHRSPLPPAQGPGSWNPESDTGTLGWKLGRQTGLQT